MAFINSLYKQFRIYFSGSYPRIFAYCEKHKAILKFFIAGGFAGATDLIALFIFHQLLRQNILVSTSLAFVFAFIVSFNLQKLWTFRNYGYKKLARQLVLYFAGAFISLNLNGLGMHWLVINLGVWYLLAQVLVNLVLGILNFFNYKFIVFKANRHEN